MAFKLSRQECSRHAELGTELTSKLTLLEKALNEDPVVSTDVATAAAMFQTVMEEAEEFRNEIAERLRDEFNDKSEKWQEGDKGDEVNSLIDEWESADFSDELDLLEPEIEGLEEKITEFNDLPTGG